MVGGEVVREVDFNGCIYEGRLIRDRVCGQAAVKGRGYSQG